ncbi:bifunctional folylpolyglutamate synthase/dihydrofolate synthase [Peptoniphilus catoniae]|uniref:bifunctional folylpolyglutamate synthase/dihydrofolate synthase n=1 Tax=Peptoniphilus catoniae TaxID=1660341 RepID=UPI0010FE831F|nr:folylpolyglutamate synthase/dihydrofolate synthase family protein [Peptoniphilus catoniae]
MNVQEIIKNIEERDVKRKSFSLDRMRKMLELLGNPQKGLKSIHVAGTNGKGSTSNFIYNMLLKAGYNVGITISPHIERYNERIVVSNEEISDNDFKRLGEKVLEEEKSIIEDYEKLTYFEFITSIAFLYFKEKNCDLCVLEVGMGGLSDSTNVIESEDKLLAIITPVSFDHMAFLGNTLTEIASQKAGIITKGTTVISSNKDSDVVKVLREKSLEEEADFYDLDDIEILDLKIDDAKSSYSIKFKSQIIKDIKVNLIGYYQVYNSAIAIAGLMELRNKGKIKISDSEIRFGIAATKWPGRMELISKNPRILLDGAHNYDGIKNLAENLKLFSYDKLYLISSILSDKEHKKMLEILSSYSNDIILLDLDNKRKTDMSILKEEAKNYFNNVEVSSNLVGAIEKLKARAGKKDLVVITGSLYMVSEVKKIMDI